MVPTLPSIRVPGTQRVITRIGLGGMNLSLPGRPERGEAIGVIRASIEAGVTLIDTADSYAIDQSEIGHNERLIAEALESMGLSVADGPIIVATKGGLTRPGGRWRPDGRPASLRAACEASLRALNTDRIPLYQLHAPDPAVPFMESVGTIAALRDEGKVEAVGLSNVGVEQIELASSVAPIASVQNAFSTWDVGYRRSEVVEHCRKKGILFLAYSPLGGKGRASSLSEAQSLARLAVELDATAQELALAWLIHQSPVMVPIPGATTIRSAQSSARSAALTLDRRTLTRVRGALRALPGHAGLLQRAMSRLSRALE
jgi:aryl-alcohol dehydrogenase-like predicted oxidoreductase